MFLLHSKALPKLDVFFRETFALAPEEVALFASPVAQGWTGASLRGVTFQVLNAREYDRERFEALFPGRPLRVLHCGAALAQSDEARAFACEVMLPALANALGGVVVRDGEVVHRSGEATPDPSSLLAALRLPAGPDAGADDWSDL